MISTTRSLGAALRDCLALFVGFSLMACQPPPDASTPILHWYVFKEPSGAFDSAARRCSEMSAGDYRIRINHLPADADQQREQLVRRLAARDSTIDILGMDVIWTAEFAAAGWILPWPEAQADAIRRGRLPVAVESASYRGRLWAVPLTSNAQLLWYRADRLAQAPRTWDETIRLAETLNARGAIQLQGERYEGLTVFFTALLASAGGAVIDASGMDVSLEEAPTRAALQIMRRLGRTTATDPALDTHREDHARLAWETGIPSLMINYTFVWPSAQAHVPELARHMRWARWPAVHIDRPSRVTLGGVNLGVGAYSHYPKLARRAAHCLAQAESQKLAAMRGGLPPTLEYLYDDPALRAQFPFADILRVSLRDAVLRAQTPLYNDISLAISRTLHPMRDIDPNRDVTRLRHAVQRALRSEGLL